MAELADVPDLGSGAFGVQVRPLLSAPSDQYSNLLERFGCWSLYFYNNLNYFIKTYLLNRCMRRCYNYNK